MKSPLAAAKTTANRAPNRQINVPANVVHPLRFERVAHIIERGLTDEPTFDSAPGLLGTLRDRNDDCQVRFGNSLQVSGGRTGDE